MKLTPSTLMKSMIETIVNIQQNDSQMMDQMVGQLGGYLTVRMYGAALTSAHSIKVMPGMQVPGILISRKYTVISSRYRKQPMKAGTIMLLHRMIRAITMLRVADCYGPMPYSQVKKR